MRWDQVAAGSEHGRYSAAYLRGWDLGNRGRQYRPFPTNPRSVACSPEHVESLANWPGSRVTLAMYRPVTPGVYA